MRIRTIPRKAWRGATTRHDIRNLALPTPIRSIPAYGTRTTPVMCGCGAQWYTYSPAASKVTLKRSPSFSSDELSNVRPSNAT